MSGEQLSPVQRLTAEHDLEGFTCGREELDDWLRRHALDSERRDIARTFVVCSGRRRVAGYYSLTMGAVRMAEKTGVTLVAFARRDRHVVYAHPERLK